MSKYIIFVDSIINMGGSQQYCRNKILFYRQLGFDVFVFSSYRGHIFIKELKEFEKNVIEHLRYSPSFFSHWQQERIIHKIVAKTGNLSRTDIIDSSSIFTGEWAEMIAEKFGCKSVIFAVDETFSINKDEFDFLFFKLKQKALFTTSPATTKLMFKNYTDLEDAQLLSFDVACSNVVDDVDTDLINHFLAGSKIIGCFGRLDKEYVLEDALLLKEYANIHSDTLFTFVFIGGGTKRVFYKRIVNIFKKQKNVCCFITDYIFPVPRSLLSKIDVCLASSGCAEACVNEKVPTIYVNSKTGLPLGIASYEIDIFSHDYRLETNDNVSLYGLLNHMLFEIDYRSLPPVFIEKKIETKEEIKNTFMKQFDLINQAASLSYFEIRSIKPHGLKQIIYSLFGKFFGIRVLSFVHIKVLHFIKCLFK